MDPATVCATDSRSSASTQPAMKYEMLTDAFRRRVRSTPARLGTMLDWLLHRSVVFNIDGDSYRMRTHRARAEQVRGVVSWGISLIEGGEFR
jgi:hypothetical protein